MRSSGNWEVYIIEAESGKWYTGITNDLPRRFSEHQEQRKGARFFSFSAPKRIVFRETYPSRSAAAKRESAIKKMSRKQKEALVTDG